MLYFRSKDRWYLTYLDPSGEELYVVVDPPAGAVPAVPATPAERRPRRPQRRCRSPCPRRSR